MRVRLTSEAIRRGIHRYSKSKTGIVISIVTDPHVQGLHYVRVRQDGVKQAETFAMEFWEEIDDGATVEHGLIMKNAKAVAENGAEPDF